MGQCLAAEQEDDDADDASDQRGLGESCSRCITGQLSAALLSEGEPFSQVAICFETHGSVTLDLSGLRHIGEIRAARIWAATICGMNVSTIVNGNM